MWRLRDDSGLTLLEVLLALATVITLTGMAIPLASNTLDELRTAAAARYVEARIQSARMAAVTRSTAIGLQFEQTSEDYTFAEYSDGNGNGIRATEIRQGIDRPLRPSERLGDRFAGVRFELMEGAPDADGDTSNGADGVRIGAARIMTMSSDGTATSGTLYIRGRRGQYAVRVLGVTGRTRML